MRKHAKNFFIASVFFIVLGLFLFFQYQHQEKNHIDTSPLIEDARFALSRRDYSNARAALLKALAAQEQENEAHFLLGLIEINGWGKDPDIAAGLAHLESLVAQEDQKALLEAGVIYSKSGTPWFDYDKAISYFTLAAQQGEVLSMRNLGILYAQGDPDNNIPPDDEKAEYWFEKARKHGSFESSFALAAFKLQKSHYSSLKTDVLPLLEEAAAKSHIPALLLLGSLHWRHESDTGSPEKAGEYFKKAAQLCAEGAYRYSLWLEQFPEKKLESRKWIERAAEAELPQAQFMLGLKIEQGMLGELLRYKAIGWYEKAAQHQHARALNRLGIIWHRGAYGVPRDDEKALSYFAKAADKNLAEAQNNLALFILYSNDPNYLEAKILLEKAAEQGYYPAIKNLKILQENLTLSLKSESESVETESDVL